MKELERVKVKFHGQRAMLLHNGRAASPTDPYGIAMKEINSKRKKTLDDHWNLYKLQFESSLYFDPWLEPNDEENNSKEGVGPYLPGMNVLYSIREGGKLNRLGKKILQSMFVEEEICPILYKGPRDLKSLWGDGKSPFVDIRQVGTGQNGRFDICRPIFRDWIVEATFAFDTQMIDLETFLMVVNNTGNYIGMGAFRQIYGRFDFEYEILTEEEQEREAI